MRTQLWLLLVPALAACPNRPQAPLDAPPPATITSFTVTPAQASPGELVTVEWGTTNATSISLEHVGVGPVETNGQLSGRATVTIESTTLFVLSAQGPGGGDLKTATATISGLVRGALFTALPNTVDADQSTTLVWSAPTAEQITLREAGGATLDTKGQVQSGSIEVRPAVTTTYELVAGRTTVRTTVTVNPTVRSFTAEPSVATFGEPLRLRWDVRAASSVSLTRAGAPVALSADAGLSGEYVDTSFPEVPPDGFLTYVLEARDGDGRAARQALEVPMGGAVDISTLSVPRYALSGSPYTVAWTTRGATTAQLVVDGQPRFVAPTPAEVAAGSFRLPAPTESAVLTFTARNGRGGEATETRVVEGVGPLAYNSFTADKATIAGPGEPVLLRWSVTNARNVRITNSTQTGFFRSFTGKVDTGSLVVFPNSRGAANRITYTLSADNGTGSAPVSRSVEVVVGGTSASLQIARRLPVGARTTLDGASIPQVTGVSGVGGVEKNVPGDAFIDIRKTGTPVNFGAANAVNFVVSPNFEATLFGSRVNFPRLNISKFGWFRVTSSALVTPGPAENDSTFGTQLEGLAVAPYWRNLNTADGQVHWRFDDAPDARRIIVQWSNVRSVDGPVDGRATFQAQVYSNGRVVFAYRELRKVPGGTAGIVNFSESNELRVTEPITSGDTFRLFGVQGFPASLRIETAPFAAFGRIGNETIDLEATGSILTNNQVAISELHPRPLPGVTNGEWLELRSLSSTAIDLSDWDLDFGGGSTFTLPMGTMLPAQGRLLLAQAADLGDPSDGGVLLADGGVVARPAVDHLYPATASMGRAAGSVRLGVFGAEYFRLTYPAGGRVGGSLGFEDERFSYVRYDVAGTRLSCASLRPIYSVSGQHGSPGLPNQTCWAYDHWLPVGTPFASIASTGTRVVFDPPDPGFPADDEGLFVLNLQQPLMLFGQPTTTITISTNGFVTPYALTPCFDAFLGDNACLGAPINPGAPGLMRPPNVIGPFWEDLDGTANSNAGVFYQVSSNGDVLVSWEHTVTWAPTPRPTMDLNFQVMLYANGDIEFRYGGLSAGPGTVNYGGSIGTVLATDIARGRTSAAGIDMQGRAIDRVNSFTATMPGLSPNTHFFYRMSMAR